MFFLEVPTPILVLLACSLTQGSGRSQGPLGPRNSWGQALGGPIDKAGRYESYAKRHGRVVQPGSKEFEERKELFAKRAALVALHNSKPDRLWNAGINHLSDRTEAELAGMRGWRGTASPGRGDAVVHVGPQSLLTPSKGVSLPQTFDNWTKLSSLGRVRDQGGCGSCWAVASAVMLEAHAEIYGTSSAGQFSVQELVDCVPNKQHCGGKGGCDGATIELAMNWAIKHGLAMEDENPYEGADGSCRKQGGRSSLAQLSIADDSGEDLAIPGVHHLNSKESSFLASRHLSFGMRAWERLPENENQPLLTALVERGPVGVSVAATDWYLYSSGVFDACSKDAVIDHAVVLIGIGIEEGSKYWLIQNSWGRSWGQDGRIKLLRHDSEHDHCGIDHQPEDGTGCDGGPAQVKVCGMCGVLYDSVVPHFRD